MNTNILAQSTDKDIIRFEAKVSFPANMDDTNACWTWTGAKHGQGRGYGKFRLGGRVVSAHKASHILFNGDVDNGLVVGHLCNNECCVNPHHLVAQTQSDNMSYAVICGRHNSQSLPS